MRFRCSTAGPNNPLHRASADAELPRDLEHPISSLTTLADLAFQLLAVLGLLLRRLWPLWGLRALSPRLGRCRTDTRSAKGLAVFLRPGEASPDSFLDNRPLELRE